MTDGVFFPLLFYKSALLNLLDFDHDRECDQVGAAELCNSPMWIYCVSNSSISLLSRAQIVWSRVILEDLYLLTLPTSKVFTFDVPVAINIKYKLKEKSRI